MRGCGILWLAVACCCLAPAAFSAEVLTNDTIVSMVKAGLGDEVIVGKIRISQGQFDLSTERILHLKQEGVSEGVLKAMLEASLPPAPPEAKAAEALERQAQEAIALYRQGKVAEAAAAFDRLIAASPNDDALKVWKALALLEQAREAKDRNQSGYKFLVVSAYRILQPLGRKLSANPDWNFAMAKAFWLNDRPQWAKRAAEKAVDMRLNYAEPLLLLGDLAYDESIANTADARAGVIVFTSGLRSQFEKVLAIPDLSPALRAEAFYKLGLMAATLDKKKDTAREYWESAVAADSACRYGVMAQERLKGVAGK